MKSRDGYSYEGLKEFKAKLDDRQIDITKKEREIDETRRLMTQRALELERRELELEGSRIEKELVLKEKSLVDEQILNLKKTNNKLKAENDNLTHQIKEKEQALDSQLDMKTVVAAKSELERIKILNESMKFKYNDYDRLMQELMYRFWIYSQRKFS